VLASKRPSSSAAAVTPAASASAARPPSFTCTASPAEDIRLDKNERVGLDLDGSVLVAKNFVHAPEVTKATANGPVSMIPHDNLYDVGRGFDDVVLFPSHDHGRPALITAFGQKGPYIIYAFSQQMILGVTRVDGHITGLASTEFDRSPVVVSTTDAVGATFASTSQGVTVIETRTGEYGLIEKGPSFDPAVASDSDHVVIAWRTKDGVRFAVVDSYLAPLRSPITVTTESVPPAVTFDGTVADVFWTSPRLMRTRIPLDKPDASTFETIAISGEAKNPHAVQLANKKWALVWTELLPAPVIKVSPLDANGAVTAPIELARGAIEDRVDDPHARTDDPTVLWHDGNGIHTTKLSCGRH
jgi:hypothetical protein